LGVGDGVDQPGGVVSQRRDVTQRISDGRELSLGVINKLRNAGGCADSWKQRQTVKPTPPAGPRTEP